MSTQFSIETTDGVYSYSNTDQPGQIRFTLQNNNQFSDTQGYLRKTQKGQTRIRANILLGVTRAQYEDTFIPMFKYNDNVEVTFERNIPGNDSSSGVFVFENLRITREFDNGNNYEIELILTEIIST